MPKKPVKQTLDVPYTIRLSKTDVKRLEALAERLPIKASGLAREALRRGLALIEENPAVLLERAPVVKRKKIRPRNEGRR